MHNRAARLILLFLFFIAISTATYLFWRGESNAAAQAADARAFDESTRTLERALLEIRASQRAYLAQAQAGDLWAVKVAQGVQQVREATAALRARATTAQAQTGFDEIRSSMDDFVKVDRRAVEYVKRDQRPLAGDVIFADGVELTDAGLAALARARESELRARAELVAEAGRRSLFAIAAGAAAAVLAVLLLVPTPSASPRIAPAEPRVAPTRPLVTSTVTTPAVQGEHWRAGKGTPAAPIEPPAGLPDLPIVADAGTDAGEPADGSSESAPTLPASSGHAQREDESADAADVPAAAVEATDFPGLALLCNDLARVTDTRALPSLLDRAASVLDASGIILWIADPDGRELNPIFAQGYPQQLVNRLGTIPRDAENATAAAFRTSLLQTVMADAISPGAIAAPLVTSGGCVGVMAAEVRHDAERQDLKLAAASIVAAQLATLVGPPTARPSSRAGAAGG
jgi:CHASE3 domain sensor protein